MNIQSNKKYNSKKSRLVSGIFCYCTFWQFDLNYVHMLLYSCNHGRLLIFMNSLMMSEIYGETIITKE